MNGTVKQFKDAIEEMRKIYPFKDEYTHLSTHDMASRENNRLELCTVDEETNITICMSKDIGFTKYEC